MIVWAFTIINSEIVYVYTDGRNYWEITYHGVTIFSNVSGYKAIEAMNQAIALGLVEA